MWEDLITVKREDIIYEKPTHNEYDPQLEKEREAFLKQLEVDWEE